MYHHNQDTRKALRIEYTEPSASWRGTYGTETEKKAICAKLSGYATSFTNFYFFFCFFFKGGSALSLSLIRAFVTIPF